MHFRNFLLAVGIAALVVGVVLAVIWFQQSGSAPQSARAGAETQSVLVAASAIKTGTLLRKDEVSWQVVPRDRVPPAAILEQPDADKALLGAVARRDFAAGEPLVPGGFVKPGERGFLAAVLSPGMRAVSIPVDAASSAAGLVQPGDRVDVLLAQNLDTGGNNGGAVSETVLQNVRIIAVDQWFSDNEQPVSGGGGRFGTVDSRVPKTVTLEVNEADGKRLLVAGQLGKLTLAVRALTGAYAVPVRPESETEPVWASDVSAAAGHRSGAKRASSGGPAAVRVLRGSKAGSP